MKNSWGEARTICKSFNLELMTLETLNEANSFLTMADNHSYFKFISWVFFIIDGTSLTPKSTTDWYWIQTRHKTSFPIRWARSQPDDANNDIFIP